MMVSFIVVLSLAAAFSLLLTRSVAWRASFFLNARMNRSKRLEPTLWDDLHFEIAHFPASLIRPRVHASCWYLAPSEPKMLRELLRVSKGRAEKFGSLLPSIAEKMLHVPVDERVARWERVMQVAERSTEERERLATPGYSLVVCLTSVEQDLPLEYASALVAPGAHLVTA